MQKRDDLWKVPEECDQFQMRDRKVRKGSLLPVFSTSLPTPIVCARVNICIKESPDPLTTLSVRQPRNSTVTTFRIDTANPPRCIFRTLHEISLWYRQSTLETIHHWNKESPGWSPLMLFARIIKIHENARQILPTAFTSLAPSAYFDDECEYEATRDWMGKQIRDPSNEEIIKETCEILRGFYFQGVRSPTSSKLASIAC